MPARTAVCRTAAVGLGAVGALVLATPAAALDAPVLGTVAGPVAAVVDPLLTPLAPVADPTTETVVPVVEEVVAVVVPPAPPTAPAPGDPQPKTTAPTQPAPTRDGAAQPGPQPAAGQPGPAATVGDTTPAPPAADPTVTTASVGGTGFAAWPGSIMAIEGLAARTGAGGVGTAANPMSLFGAPQIAMAPQPEAAASVAPPSVFTPAGGQIPDLVPVGAPESVPGLLAALACTVVAGAAAAHVAALRSRRAAPGVPA